LLKLGDALAVGITYPSLLLKVYGVLYVEVKN
jgi:hypothetical protein